MGNIHLYLAPDRPHTRFLHDIAQRTNSNKSIKISYTQTTPTNMTMTTLIVYAIAATSVSAYDSAAEVLRKYNETGGSHQGPPDFVSLNETNALSSRRRLPLLKVPVPGGQATWYKTVKDASIVEIHKKEFNHALKKFYGSDAFKYASGSVEEWTDKRHTRSIIHVPTMLTVGNFATHEVSVVGDNKRVRHTADMHKIIDAKDFDNVGDFITVGQPYRASPESSSED